MKDIQSNLYELLQSFISICRENDLRYYAWGGTALGAVRHKGFIPWDDDIDIAMPREDFEKLCLLSELNLLPEGFRAEDSDELLFGAFEDLRVEVSHGNKEWDNRQPNLSIDLFPLDGVPANPVTRQLHSMHSMGLFVLIKLKRLNYIRQVEDMKSRTETRPKIEQMLIQFGSVFEVLLRPIGEKKLVDRYRKCIKRYPFNHSDRVAYYSSRYRRKAIIPRSWVGRGKSVKFEDAEVLVFQHVEDYLAHIFGPNYMELPPEKARERHGDLKVVHDGHLSPAMA